MSALAQAMVERSAYIVLHDSRPFSYLDFVPSFVWEGQEYRLAHGTFRNHASALVKKGQWVPLFRSPQSFYSLPGHTFAKGSMTVYPTMVSTASNRFLDYLLGLPLREHSIHDIHLEFQCPNLYQFMRRHFPVGDVNLEIRPKGLLPSGVGLVVRTKDSVGVEIACSNSPFPISPDGIMKFTELLVRTHDRLSEFLVANQEKRLAGSIPHYTDWVVKMWHFGADSAVGYSGEKFELTYKQANSVLFRVYSKELEGKKSSIRMECQELPDKSLIAALVEKLDRL